MNLSSELQLAVSEDAAKDLLGHLVNHQDALNDNLNKLTLELERLLWDRLSIADLAEGSDE